MHTKKQVKEEEKKKGQEIKQSKEPERDMT